MKHGHDWADEPTPASFSGMEEVSGSVPLRSTWTVSIGPRGPFPILGNARASDSDEALITARRGMGCPVFFPGDIPDPLSWAFSRGFAYQAIPTERRSWADMDYKDELLLERIVRSSSAPGQSEPERRRRSGMWARRWLARQSRPKRSCSSPIHIPPLMSRTTSVSELFSSERRKAVYLSVRQAPQRLGLDRSRRDRVDSDAMGCEIGRQEASQADDGGFGRGKGRA